MSTISTNSFEVIILGSGPAGCAAASTCAKAGLNVLIVTAQPEPYLSIHNFPGPLESIHPGVSTVLGKLGLSGAESSATRSFYTGIYSGKNYTPLGEDASGIWQGKHINRKAFNAQLINQTKAVGVEVLFNERVDDFLQEDGKVTGIKIRSNQLSAKYIIDATGKKALAGKKLKFRQRFFSRPLVCWTGISLIDENFSLDQRAAHFIPRDDGWTWLAPQPPDHCAWTRLSMKGEKSFLPPEELSVYPVIGKTDVANMRWRLYHPVCSEGLLLCGDAGGILDPAAGQGIFNALLSGLQAAITVTACINQPELEAFHLAFYNDWFVREFEAKVGNLSAYYKDHGINL